jgi:hypothetical protein
MKLLVVQLLFATSLFAQDPCEDFLVLLGQRDIYKVLTDFNQNCGPFVETMETDGMSKTWSNPEKGIIITFINRAAEKHALPKFEVMMVELTAFTNQGGYKGNWPFGFSMGMDHKMVKSHITQLKSVSFEKRDLSKTNSTFVYTGSANAVLGGRQVKVSVLQFDGNTISSMLLRLK